MLICKRWKQSVGGEMRFIYLVVYVFRKSKNTWPSDVLLLSFMKIIFYKLDLKLLLLLTLTKTKWRLNHFQALYITLSLTRSLLQLLDSTLCNFCSQFSVSQSNCSSQKSILCIQSALFHSLSLLKDRHENLQVPISARTSSIPTPSSQGCP